MFERKRGRKGRPGARRMSGPNAEGRRLQSLHGQDVLDAAADPVLDDLVRAAATVAGVPTSLVSLVDEHRQRFKAPCDLDATETGRDISFCAHVVPGDSELDAEGVGTVPPRPCERCLRLAGDAVAVPIEFGCSSPEGSRVRPSSSRSRRLIAA